MRDVTLVACILVAAPAWASDGSSSDAKLDLILRRLGSIEIRLGKIETEILGAPSGAIVHPKRRMGGIRPYTAAQRDAAAIPLLTNAMKAGDPKARMDLTEILVRQIGRSTGRRMPAVSQPQRRVLPAHKRIRGLEVRLSALKAEIGALERDLVAER